MGPAAPPCDAMSEPCASSITDLCIVTAVDVEFKIAARLLSGKSFSEDLPWERNPGSAGILACELPASADCPNQAGKDACAPRGRPQRMKICRGLFGGRRVTILQSGMGAVGFAEGLAKHLTNNRYDALIVSGLAGGLDPRLRVGDAVLYNFCYDARVSDFTRRERPGQGEVTATGCDETLSGFLCRALTNSGLSFIQAPGITVGRVVTEAKEKLALGARYGAAAVDMETYETLKACARLGLPAAALRVISDEAVRDIPDFNRIYNADGRMNGWRTFAAMAARPSAALRLLMTFRPALQSLKATLQAAMGA
jgi:adenosylhomocysteine nucleosidase